MDDIVAEKLSSSLSQCALIIDIRKRFMSGDMLSDFGIYKAQSSSVPDCSCKFVIMVYENCMLGMLKASIG